MIFNNFLSFNSIGTGEVVHGLLFIHNSLTKAVLFQICTLAVVETAKLALNYNDNSDSVSFGGGKVGNMSDCGSRGSPGYSGRRRPHSSGRTVAYLRREQRAQGSPAGSPRLRVKSMRIDPALIQQKRLLVQQQQQQNPEPLSGSSPQKKSQLDSNNNKVSYKPKCKHCFRGCYKCTKIVRTGPCQASPITAQSVGNNPQKDLLPKTFDTFLYFANGTVLGQRKRPSMSQLKRRSRRSLDTVYEEDEGQC